MRWRDFFFCFVVCMCAACASKRDAIRVVQLQRSSGELLDDSISISLTDSFSVLWPIHYLGDSLLMPDSVFMGCSGLSPTFRLPVVRRRFLTAQRKTKKVGGGQETLCDASCFVHPPGWGAASPLQGRFSSFLGTFVVFILIICFIVLGLLVGRRL